MSALDEIMEYAAKSFYGVRPNDEDVETAKAELAALRAKATMAEEMANVLCAYANDEILVRASGWLSRWLALTKETP